MIDENCKGCNMESPYRCYNSTHRVTFHRMVRMAKENGREFIYSKCPCGTCLIKGMCTEKCDALKKHEASPDSITIYSGL